MANINGLITVSVSENSSNGLLAQEIYNCLGNSEDIFSRSCSMIGGTSDTNVFYIFFRSKTEFDLPKLLDCEKVSKCIRKIALADFGESTACGFEDGTYDINNLVSTDIGVVYSEAGSFEMRVKQSVGDSGQCAFLENHILKMEDLASFDMTMVSRIFGQVEQLDMKCNKERSLLDASGFYSNMIEKFEKTVPDFQKKLFAMYHGLRIDELEYKSDVMQILSLITSHCLLG